MDKLTTITIETNGKRAVIEVNAKGMKEHCGAISLHNQSKNLNPIDELKYILGGKIIEGLESIGEL